MSNNIDTNPCDNDLNRTKTVEKIQVRRGKRIKLPQPLKAGEFGFSMDDRKLYIGTACQYSPTGVQIEVGEFSYAQTLIDNSIIEVELDQAYTDAEWETFKGDITTAHPAITEALQVFNGDTTIFVGMPDGFTDDAALISTIESQLNVDTASVGVDFTVNMSEGTISMSDDTLAGMLVHILNNIADRGIAKNLLNVKIYTEADISIGDIANWNEAYSWGDPGSAGYELQANKGVADGYAPLDANIKIPSQYLPALALTEVFVVADIPARDALTVGTGDGEIQEGDVAIVTDASDDPDVDSGSASYIYDGTDWQKLKGPDAAGLDYWEEVLHVAVPNDTNNTLQWTVTNASDDVNLALTPKGEGALQAQVADGTIAGGNVRGVAAVDWQMAWREEPTDVASGYSSVIAGGAANEASGQSSVVCGGEVNRATDTWSTIVGGNFNTANGSLAFIGGGNSNTNNGTQSTISGGFDNSIDESLAVIGGGSQNHVTEDGPIGTIGGGDNNTVSGWLSTIAGGSDNLASGAALAPNGRATVGGGGDNQATGTASTVPGGRFNTAAGDYSFAAGRRAKANHDGAFVLTDSQDVDELSVAVNELRMRFANGAFLNGLRLVLEDATGNVDGTRIDGGGIKVTSPDGLTTRIIGIDDSGNIEVRVP